MALFDHDSWVIRHHGVCPCGWQGEPGGDLDEEVKAHQVDVIIKVLEGLETA
jgi:hypothetical protein